MPKRVSFQGTNKDRQGKRQIGVENGRESGEVLEVDTNALTRTLQSRRSWEEQSFWVII